MPHKSTTLLKEEASTYQEIKNIFSWIMDARGYKFGYTVQRDDILHDVLLELLTYIDIDFATGKMEGVDNQINFLISVFINKSNKTYEREKERSTNIVREFEIESLLTVRADDNAVIGNFARSMILSLVPPKEREVLTLKQQGYQHKEISEALGISVAASKKRIQRAKEGLILTLASERRSRYL